MQDGVSCPGMFRSRLLVPPVLIIAFWLVAPHAQVRPVYDLGANGLSQVLERLQTTASVLHTGAHPDDEDSAFLARMTRGDNARAAYLSLNRGEGGQNIIGTELFDALGVIRTEELLQARRLDGAEQFFTRTFDYGFSKTLTEAKAKWNERDVLGDMVRVIRTFRPLVIYSRFTGTAADGHGQHQMAGYLTPLAFRAAADPRQFPEQLAEGLRPWQALKLYRGGGGGRPDAGASPTVQVQEGILDPVAGRSFAEISLEGRSQHKTQEMGTIETRGPVTSTLTRVETIGDAPRVEKSIFDGLDVTVPGLAALAGLPPGALERELLAIDTAAKKALTGYSVLNPASIIPALADGLTATRSARAAISSLQATAAAKADADFLLGFKERDFADALTRAAGVVVDPLADAETVAQGTTVGVSVRTFLPEGSTVQVTSAALRGPAGWTIGPATAPAPAAGGGGGFGRRETPANEVRYTVSVPASAPLTQPYYLRQLRRGDSYAWSDNEPKTMPFAPPLLTADVTLTIGGVAVPVSKPVMFRYADRVRGELRRDVNVVPAVTVGVDSKLMIVPLGAAPFQQRVVVKATSFSKTPISGTLRLTLPQGWSASPAGVPFVLQAEGDRTSATFTVTAPARRTAGTFEITANAAVGAVTWSQDLQEISYPHIQTHRLYAPASVSVRVFDLKVAPVAVGYVMGSGDQVPDALRRMGVNVTLIDDAMLATGDLGRFDTIVVGVRASEARPGFVANNGRLLEYMQKGGTLIVQYQQTDYEARNLPPYPAQAPQNSRVTDETAPVRILVPTHPVFTFPNAITTADFNNWVQERDLYSFVSFDQRYVPLLETVDPGEMPQNGGEVYARVGNGQYVYTSYAWFRQLPAGVPGAYRQFANLISLAKAPRP